MPTSVFEETIRDSMEQPIEFTIALRDFDQSLLPEDSRAVGTAPFAEAVANYFGHQFETMGGSAVVAINQEEITVSWMPDGMSRGPIDYAVSLLNEGRHAEAIPFLRLLLSARPDDGVVLYNLGLAESDQGDLDAAVRHLTRATEIDPNDANALIGLGVVQRRVGDTDAAARSLERAVEVEPRNGHAHRNLGAVLGSAGRDQEAERHLREAVRLLPNDQQALYGLACLLEQSGDREKIIEADGLYKQAVALDPHSEIAEMARRALSGLAERDFHGKSGVPVRMDAVMYCLGGLRTFSTMSQADVQAVAFEIGMLGAQGLDIDSPTSKYTLRSLPGTFSGLHLMSLMYVGFKEIAPNQDIGFDLTSEYALAQQMFSEGKAS
jgi:Flp pilus assembly protein TadD